MTNYSSLVAVNGKTEVVNVTAKNLKEAKVKASEFGTIIFIGLDEVGAATYRG